MDEKSHHAQVTHSDDVMDEKVTGKVTSVNTGSVALAAAVASQKPSLWSRNMIKLYFIMAIGYLVSTMNGFGKCCDAANFFFQVLVPWLTPALCNRQLSHG